MDTHAFLWFVGSPEQLSRTAEEVVTHVDNSLFISLASIWEIQIKVQLGKLALDMPLSELIETQQTENDVLLLPIQASHIYQLQALPSLHRDPFDRILIAQSIAEGLKLVSKDKEVHGYSDHVNVLW